RHSSLVLEHSRQMFHVDASLARQNYRPFQHIAQFPDVTRPGMPGESLMYGLRNITYPAVVLAVQVTDQELGKLLNVLLAFSQRWQVDVEYIEAVVKVLAEVPAPDGFFWNLIGGRHH